MDPKTYRRAKTALKKYHGLNTAAAWKAYRERLQAHLAGADVELLPNEKGYIEDLATLKRAFAREAISQSPRFQRG